MLMLVQYVLITVWLLLNPGPLLLVVVSFLSAHLSLWSFFVHSNTSVLIASALSLQEFTDICD